MNPAPDLPRSSETDAVLDDLFDQLTAKVQAGEPVDVEAYAREYPEQADRLRRLVPAIQALADLGLSAVCEGQPEAPWGDSSPAYGTLGDFHILREIGRGGMGVVYEANEISLGRRVALKVLPFAAMLNPDHLQRFQNEARAAASLDHPHIVRVHSVGCERGVHYYAMQYIEGQTLSAVIDQLRRERASGDRSHAMGARKLEFQRDGAQPEQAGQPETPPDHGQPSAESDTLGRSDEATEPREHTRLSSDGSNRTPAYFRGVATLGLQAAEALAHAHATGVIHRDIKPSNMMLASAPIPAEGPAGDSGPVASATHAGIEGLHLWITDFGLAMTPAETNLTMTGDVVGTLRYMSPEQVEGDRQVLDHRTDIYSLGLTLYELLTLETAFPGTDRQTVARRIIEEDPRPPRRLNKATPKDLETIVLKAIAKEPQGRYATAEQFAHDLRCFLEHKPIHARRPSLGTRLAKWSRRHQAVVWSAMAAALIAVAALGSSTVFIREAYQREKEQRQLADQQRHLANQQRQLADQRRHKAELERDAKARALVRARGFRLAAQSTAALSQDPTLGLLLALEGHQRAPGVLANNALLAAMDALHETQVLAGEGGGIRQVEFSPDGQRLLTKQDGSGDDAAVVWDVTSGKRLVQLSHNEPFDWVAFSPRGDRVLTVEYAWAEDPCDVTFRVWDATTGEERVRIDANLVGEHPSEEKHPSERIGTMLGDGRIAAFSPDGQYLVGPSPSSGTASVYDAETGEEKQVLEGHEAAVAQARFGPQGQRVLTVSIDHTLRVWDAKTGKQKLVLDWLVGKLQSSWSPPDHAAAHRITHARFSSDGQFILTRSTDTRGIRLWDARTGEQVWCSSKNVAAVSRDCARAVILDRPYRLGPGQQQLIVWDMINDRKVSDMIGHEHVVSTVAFATNGKRIVSGAENGSIRIWDVESGHEVAVLRGHTAQVETAVFAPSGSLIASGSRDATARIWSVANGAELAGIPVSDSQRWYRQRLLAIDPTGHYLFADTDYQYFTGIWNVRSAEQLVEVRNSSYGSEARLTPDGQKILTADAKFLAVKTGKTLREYSVPDAEPLWTVLGPDGHVGLVGMDNESAHLWNVKTGTCRAVLDGHTDRVNAGSFSPDGETVVTVSSDSTARLWNAANGELLHVLRGDTARFRSAVFTPDSARVVTTSKDTVVRVWSVETGKQTAVFKDPRGIDEVAIGPDGKRLITYRSNNPVVRIWDLDSGKQVAALEKQALAVYSALFSPDGEHVLTSAGEEKVRVWETETGREVLTIEPEFDAEYAVYTPDGKQILTITKRTARLWDAETGEARKTVFEHEGSVLGPPALSSDGDRLAVVFRRHTGVIWDRPRRRIQARVNGHAVQIITAAFSADGSQLLTTSRDLTARTWDAESGRQRGMWVADHHVKSVPIHFEFDAYWGPNGKRVVSFCKADPESSRNAWIWDAATGETLQCLDGHAAPVLSARLSPDGTRVITGSVDQTARIWNVGTGKEKRCLRGHEGPVAVAAFSPDNRRVLTASSIWTPRRDGRYLNRKARHGDCTARVWNLDGGKPLVLQHEHQKIDHAAFGPSGQKILTVSAKKRILARRTARLWDANTGELLFAVRGEKRKAFSAKFGPAGQYLLIQQGRGEATLVDAHSGESIVEYAMQSGLWRSWVLSGSQQVMAVNQRGEIRTWPTNPRAVAETRTPRDFTAEEREIYELEGP